MESKEDPESIALEFVACINRQDLDGVVALMTEGFTMIAHRGAPEVGRVLMAEGFRGYFSDFPKYRIHIQKITRCGNEVGLIGKTTGSHVPPQIEERETVIWVAKIEDQQVSEWRIFSDMDRIN
jgi:hypothetical protein